MAPSFLKQSRIESFLESGTSTAIGFGVALATWQFLVAPLFGYKPTMPENLGITSIFTVVSLARQYAVRRFFNGNVYFYLKAKFVGDGR